LVKISKDNINMHL